MLRSFIEADVYRIMLGCEQGEVLLEAIQRHQINHDGSVRVMRRGEDCELTVCTLFVDGEILQKLALLDALHILQVDNVSARLRAVPTMRDDDGRLTIAFQTFGAMA
ncbi:MAG: hypothetical protein NVS9B10_25320 [Nevskia sp.]